MAEKKKMTVAEILAAARKLDGGGGAPSSEAASTESGAAGASVSAESGGGESSEKVEEAAASPPAESVPASAPTPSKLKPGERPSVADILAMARTGGQPAVATPAAAKLAPKLAAEAKPAAKPAAPKTAAAKGAAAKAAPAPRPSTASILAAARGGGKPGPITKAEAAQKEIAKPKAPAAAKLSVPPLPQKPAYAIPKPAPATAVTPRPAAKGAAPVDEGRRFVLFGLLFGSFLATGYTALTSTGIVWALAIARFMFPNTITEPPSKFKIGFPDEFPPGQVNVKFKSQFGIWVVNYQYQGLPEIYALSTICTHLGCTPNWLEAEQKFKCPCHGSGFYKDGINFEGPAPRPLERYSLRIAEDGQLEVDKSHKFQQELGQWDDPASFVRV